MPESALRHWCGESRFGGWPSSPISRWRRYGSTALIEVFTSFGKMGVSAEKVGTDAASQVSAYLASEAAVSEHLADQLLLPMALAGAGSFTTAAISPHAQTNMDVIKRFLPVNFLTEQAGRGIRVEIVREYAQP
jgi:RNA 3'-terminal phosphate cyclase